MALGPAAETTAGKVRGFTRNAIHTFRGYHTALPPKAPPGSCPPKAEALDWDSQFDVLQPHLSSGTADRMEKRRERVFVPVRRRPTRRRLPAGQCLDART